MNRTVFAFSHVPKTAGITINHILRREFGLSHCDVEPWCKKNAEYFSQADFKGLRYLYPAVQSIAGHQVKPYSDLLTMPDLNVMYYLFLREPLARTASHYQYHVQIMGSKTPFDVWIKKEIQRDVQVKYLTGVADLDAALKVLRERVFFVGLVEHFDESLVMFRKKLEPWRELTMAYRRENVANSNDIKKRLLNDPQSREQLCEANELDLALYEHVCQTLYPAQKDQYDGQLEHDVTAFKAANQVSAHSVNLYANLLKRHLLYKPVLRIFRGVRAVVPGQGC